MPTLPRWSSVLVRPFFKIESCPPALLATAYQHLWQFVLHEAYASSLLFTISPSLASYHMVLAVLVSPHRLVLPFRAEYIVSAASHRTVTSPACAPRLRREKPSVLSGRLMEDSSRTITYATSCRTKKSYAKLKSVPTENLGGQGAKGFGQLLTTGNSARCHSGQPSRSRRAENPAARSRATASNASTHQGPRQ